MSWRDEWPGDPGRSDDTDSGDDPVPIRVAIKDSACAASSAVASLRDERGDVVAYPSRPAAERALVSDHDCPGLCLQAAAPNDPAPVDAYLVHTRRPGPHYEDRGSPGEGWTFDATARQVGRLSEALFDAYRYDPPPIEAYAARDLGLDPEEFRVVVDPDPPSVDGSGGDAGCVWVPDVAFAVRRERRDRSSDGALLVRYLAEVKHGSTSFERDQRAVMRDVAGDPGVEVLVIRVDLTGLPREYDLTVATVDPGSEDA